MNTKTSDHPGYKKLKELQSLIDAKRPRKRLALAVSQDAFSLDAVYKAYREGVIDPILIGSEQQTLAIAKAHGFDFYGVSIIDEPNPEKCVEIAVRMVHEGRADILMKG